MLNDQAYGHFESPAVLRLRIREMELSLNQRPFDVATRADAALLIENLKAAAMLNKSVSLVDVAAKLSMMDARENVDSMHEQRVDDGRAPETSRRIAFELKPHDMQLISRKMAMSDGALNDAENVMKMVRNLLNGPNNNKIASLVDALQQIRAGLGDEASAAAD